MYLELILSIIGGILTIGITINAFFLKNILTGQNDIRVDIAKIATTLEGHSPRIAALEKIVKRLELEAVECRGRCESSSFKS